MQNLSTAFKNFPQLTTENLILRETKLADAPAVFQVFADDEVTKYHDLETATHIEQAQFLIERRAERFKNQQGIRWGIATKENNVIIGSCGYSIKSIKNCFQAEIGYELAREYWRKGLMTEALRAIIQWGFQQLDLNRIEAFVMLENTASIKLLGNLGFVEEGLLREYGFWKGKFHDLKIFSLLRRDYENYF
ncbi:GNAT family N-acetyltransferase [Nostocaceae cyanobacterium CENA357]|uniref:GNAT family N-acetyltransferase n=1 Tax=Atlanticothrix silvestris CENA357 TaxID=1725252 RepID=A0A8J7L542_9CYAN|nr:GNAT family protein [Atlanticothrix silvestris]MBH8555461.1 GNAT family N-acetyltransferase [Atlanticothrix silvestris CENA357]